MGMPITTKSAGICFAFPNVCKTPNASGVDVPIPYPSIGQLSDAKKVCDGGSDGVFAGGNAVVTTESEIDDTTGDSAGVSGGVVSGSFGKKVKFTKGSATVFANGNAVVRLLDPTTQNDGNCVGTVLGGFLTVLVGG